MADEPCRVRDYYANPGVRARMLEYLGGASAEGATCHYLTSGDAGASHHRSPRPTVDLPACWSEGLEISRSLWDRRSLIAHLDVEYVNFDFPAEAYLNPVRTFDLQRPVEMAIEAILLDYSIVPLHLLSGRGHHFVWRIRLTSRAYKRLGHLGRVSATLRQLYARAQPPTGKTISRALGNAYAGLGLVMEYLAHRIKQVAAPDCPIPVELTAVETGPTRHGREMVSIDISEYGDPLTSRVIRVPFSLYLKPWQQRSILGEQVVGSLPPVFMIPLHAMNSREGIQIMHDVGRVQELAQCASARIPDQTKSMENLIAEYQQSPLAKFHDWFYSEEPRPAAEWPETYDRTPVEPLPMCVRQVLDHPNDRLLKPGNLERVIRVMLSLGWHPRHIAGLIQSKFERDHGWGDQWCGYDAATRADFYTRMFAGLFATGHDDLVDFNCQSAKEEKHCSATDCPYNLATYQKSLIERRNYERLACRPFNRLFLPEEHL